MTGSLCPFCGAYSPRSCELRDDIDGETCPWEESEPGPDTLREDRDERRCMEKDDPDGQ